MTTSSTNLFVGTSGGGVFLSTNYGTDWTTINSGLTNLTITALKVMGTKIFAGTVNTGIWRRPLSEIISTVEKYGEVIPEDFSLSQNYPNPFNSQTRISFSIAKESFVKLSVFDNLGNKISILVSDVLSPGNYTTHWVADKITSGVYFYTLKAGSYTKTKKAILLK